MAKTDALKAPAKMTQETAGDLLRALSPELDKALPRHIPVENFIRVALTTIRKTPRILQCTKPSILASIMESAQLGLQIDGILGHAYLVPFKGECKLIPGYKGLIALARRSGKVTSFDAHCVYENDRFDYEYGTDAFLKHRPAEGDRGELVCVYAIGRMTGGDYEFDVMDKSVVETTRKRAPSAKSEKKTPWDTDYSAMAKKTVVRRWAKLRPLSPEFQRAAELSECDAFGMDLKEATVTFKEKPLDALSAGDADTHTEPGDALTDAEKKEAVGLENAEQKELTK